MEEHFVPYYLFPEEATLALTNAVKYQELKTKATGSIPVYPDINREKSHQIIREILTGSPQRPLWVNNRNIGDLFKCYNIRFAETPLAASPEEAASIADKIGYPVVMKLNSATITHKTDVGGVILNLNSPVEVETAFNQIRSNLAKSGLENEMQGVTVQRQVSDGAEVIVGVTRNGMLGYAVMFGLGGIYAELIKIPPLNCIL